MASKEDILSAFSSFAQEPAALPAGHRQHGVLFVREMSAAESDGYEASVLAIFVDHKGKPTAEPRSQNIRARLLVKCLCDVKGGRLFEDADADMLGRSLPRGIADTLFDQARRINGLDKEDDKDQEKND